MARKRRADRTRTRPGAAAAAVLISTTVSLAVAEIALRAFSTDRYAVWPPGVDHTVPPLPELTPGIHGPSTFSTNEYGIRGRLFAEDDDYRILAIGGSTTESILVDDLEAWPHLLESALTRAFPRSRVWVGNVGRSGHSARDHLLQAERLPPQYPRIDAALVLVGVNDLSLRLRRDTEFVPFAQESPEYHTGLLTHAFSRIPLSDRLDYPFHKRLELWQLVRRLSGRLEEPPSGPDQRQGARYLSEVRERRQRAARRDSLPDLSSALADYALTLERIVGTLEDQDIKPILITQPFMWRDQLPQELEALLWFGPVGDTPNRTEDIFYTARAMAEGMRKHNEVLLDVCRERGIMCVDLASRLPKDTTVFYDDVHFNEEGSRLVASILADELARAPDVRARLAH